MYILFTFEYFSYTLCRLSLYSVHINVYIINYIFVLSRNSPYKKRRPRFEEGEWTCPECRNTNWARRERCNGLKGKCTVGTGRGCQLTPTALFIHCNLSQIKRTIMKNYAVNIIFALKKT